MRIDVYHHIEADKDQLALIIKKLNQLLVEGAGIMEDLDTLTAKVAAETTIVEGVVTLVGGLKTQLADALSGVNLTPAQQEKVDAVFAQVGANSDALAAALTANVAARGRG